jgi:aminomethyltransferase
MSPLDGWHRAAGARMVEFGGWQMPLHFEGGTIAEHMACRRGAAIFDVSHLGTVRLTGPAAWARLQGTLTNDLGKIGPGRAQYTQLLDDDGSVADDLIVWWVSEERFDVMPNASNTSSVLSALGGTDVTAERAVIAVQGPMAREVLAGLFPKAASVGRFRVAELWWGGREVVVAGTGYTGEDGVEVSLPADLATGLWEDLVRAGAVPAGLGARDTLRLEAGLPLHGHELGPGITPLEAGLSWVVSWDKPMGFRGLPALVAHRASGVKVRLAGVLGESRRPLRAGYEVDLDGVEGAAGASELTSGNYSPVLGRGIGMCFLPVEVGPGAVVSVHATPALAERGRREPLPAHVVRLPFVPKASSPVGTGQAR